MEKLLLSLLRDAMEGKKASEPTKARLEACQDRQELLKLAEMHNILPLLGPMVLETMPEGQEKARLRQVIQKSVVRQIMAASALALVTEALAKAGISHLVVKGAFCRSLYPQPEHRPSSDEDVLVAPDQMPQAERVLRELGYERGPEPEESPVHSFFSPLLHLELHSQLTEEPELEQRLRAKLQEPYFFALEGRTVPTLPPQEHFIYLAAHFYKHFLAGGLGIRQVADMAMVAKQPGICWDQVWQQLEQLGWAVLVCGVLEIGMTYLGLHDVPIPQAVQKWCPGPEPLLKDILEAGVFGASTMERKHSSLMTLEAVQGRKNSSLLRTAFPKGDQLVHRYPYLKTRPWLLPVAWCSRMVGYLREDRNPARRAAESAAVGKKRVELLRQYHLIP